MNKNLETPAEMTPVWRTVLGGEWRLLRRDPGWWLVLGVLAVCMAYALAGGAQRLTERRAAVLEAQNDETQRLSRLQGELTRLAQGGTYKGEAFRDPGNPLSVGRAAAAPIADLPDAPWAGIAVGISDLYPASFKVAVGSRDRFLFADEIANPSSLAGGSFDVAFVVVYLLPLLLLALSYNVLSSEREHGTLALTLASSAPLPTVLFTKLALRGAGVAAIVLVTLGLHALLGGPQAASADAGLAALVLILAVVAYTAFWLALALWVNARQFDSALNAVLLVSAWLLLVVVMPAAINATASVIHPAPARSEMVLAIRQAAIDTDRDRESEQARFQQEHAQTGAASPTTADQRRLGLLLATQGRADQVLDRHEAMVQQQRTLSDRLAFLNPPMLINDLIAEVAGNGQTRWDAHLQEVKTFHAKWQNYFVALAQRGSRVGLEDMAQWPRWPHAARATMSAQSSARVLPTLVWVGVCAFVLVLLSKRSLARVA